MDPIRQKSGAIASALLAMINLLTGFGVVLPHGVDAEGVALLNSAAISIGALVVHLIKPKAP